MKNLIKNLAELIRLKICIFICAIGVSGYLLFNSLNINLVLVALTSFFGAAGAYSLNNIRDKKEDLINRKSINPFTLNKNGLLIVFTCFLIGFFFSLLLPIKSIFFYSLGIIVSIIYSFFKIKKYLLIKNIYTGFSASLMFLVGAANVSVEIIKYYLLTSFFIFIGSIISDLRDYKGDKINSIKTLPVFLGYDKTRKIVFISLVLFSFLVVYSHFIFLLPFSFAMLFFVYKNIPKIAHSLSGISLVFLAFVLLVGGV